MAIPILTDVKLPNSVISAGVRGKNLRLNSRVTTDSGYEYVNVVSTRTIRQFEIGTVPMRVDQWQAIEALHEITDAGAFGFLMEDPKDCNVSTGGIFEVVPTPPNADPTVAYYRLIKRYTDTSSGRTMDRVIRYPKAVTVYTNGLPTGASVSTLDGLATIAGSPDVEALTWTGSFYIPVHFVDDVIDWELVVAGPSDTRFLSGPSVVLQEVRE